MRTKLSFAFTVTLFNLSKSIFTGKIHIKKNSTGGNSQKFIANIKFFVFLLTENFFLTTEIRKAGVIVQLLTIDYLNTNSRITMTLSIILYSFEHKSYPTARRVV
jgi:hypothetical protein